MGQAQGKKVEPSAVAVQAIEAQPPFGKIKPGRGHVLARDQRQPWGQDVADREKRLKKCGRSGEAKETQAKKEATRRIHEVTGDSRV